jgi:hypothetical protein
MVKYMKDCFWILFLIFLTPEKITRARPGTQTHMILMAPKLLGVWGDNKIVYLGDGCCPKIAR